MISHSSFEIYLLPVWFPILPPFLLPVLKSSLTVILVRFLSGSISRLRLTMWERYWNFSVISRHSIDRCRYFRFHGRPFNFWLYYLSAIKLENYSLFTLPNGETCWQNFLFFPEIHGARLAPPLGALVKTLGWAAAR
jgi:hypothetical protein